MSAALHRLAHAHGVFTVYTDGLGRECHADDEALLVVLRSLGVPLDDAADADDALRAHRAKQSARLLDPVVVAWDGRLDTVDVRWPTGRQRSSVVLTIAGEEGRETWLHRVFSADDLDVHVASDRRDGPLSTLRVDVALPLGYYQLRAESDHRRETALLVAAPFRCPSVPHPAWGAFLPLYALGTRRDWGVGDLSDFAELQRWLARHGGRYTFTLPIFATFLAQSGPFEPSPYLPVSRRFWNEIFLDVDALAEAQTDAVRPLLDAQPTLIEREALRRCSHVDYRRVARLKRGIVAECARVLRDSPQRHAAFRAWLDEDPDRLAYACFRAACERHGPPSSRWPRSSHPTRTGIPHVDRAATDYHAYAQWAMEEQLARLARPGAAAPALDLPLGVHPAGFDVWRQPQLFADGVQLGAPPDDFMTAGQDWSSPPLQPLVSSQTSHRYYISCLRALMRHAGVVRLDHVMGLHRQFFVPAGREPGAGTYVSFPADELYAVTALEAQRHEVIVVGEDLGTVPDAVRRAMADHGLLRTYVMQGAPLDADTRPTSPDAGSVASLSTHDMPTFAGFWQDADLEDERGRPLRTSWASAERGRRRSLRAALVGLARAAEHAGPDDDSDLRTVVRECLRLLAGSDAAIVVVDLEDLWLETRPQNVPGTSTDAAWRRKAILTLDELAATTEVRALLDVVDHARKEVVGWTPC